MQKSRRPARSILGLVLAVMVLLTKSTKIIAALKLLKFGKPLVTIVSMAISAIAYGIWLGPWFGVGLVAMIFIHEMGHVVALRLKGFETPGPVFIPFLGAAIFAPKFKDRDAEAFVGYGGPLLGTIGALACLAAWPFAEGKVAEILLLVSYIGIFLNLFNLIPIHPFDGGRIMQVIGDWFKYLGLGLLLVFSLAAREPALLLIWVLILDGFERMTLWLRPVLAAALGLAMLALMALGYSGQPWYANVVDVVIAAFLLWMYWSKDHDRSRGTQEKPDDRPYPSAEVRGTWLALYLALAAITTISLLYQTTLMPEAVKMHSEQLTSEVK